MAANVSRLKDTQDGTVTVFITHQPELPAEAGRTSIWGTLTNCEIAANGTFAVMVLCRRINQKLNCQRHGASEVSIPPVACFHIGHDARLCQRRGRLVEIACIRR